MNPLALRRFLKYSTVGVSTFCLDLFLLFILTDFFLWNYVISAGVAFTLAVSVNYYFSRRFVFRGTLRSAGEGYAVFLGIAGTGLVAVMVLMGVFVEVLHLNYLFSRVIIAGVVGIWNYFMNLYVNFKVAGKYE